MLLSEYKSRIQGFFEGGNSLSIDWYTNVKQAGEAMRGQINPTTLKRSVQIYGGLYDGNETYYCPNDVDVPVTLYNPRNTREKWDYMPVQAYYNNTDSDKFTIDTINGAKRIKLRNGVSSSSQLLNTFDVVGTKTGVTLTVNHYDFLSGTGALQGTFTDTNTTISGILPTPIDITDYLNGIFVIPANFQKGSDVESVTVKLYTTPNDFYTLVMEYPVVDGWNIMRMALSGMTKTGFPVDTNIVSYSIEYKMKTGKSQIVITDRISLIETYLYNFEYYSNNMFIDSNGNWVSTPTDITDKINVSEKEADILVYEGCRIVALSNLKRKDVPPFDQELMRKYNSYWADNPSSALPQTYVSDTGISKGFLME